jgi:membrane-bound serine protease (ClpP class)
MSIWVMVLLVVVGLAIILLEPFVPSGGVLGLLGGGSMIAGIAMAYYYQGGVLGTIFLVACVILVPTILILGFRAFPGSFMGKRLIMDQQLKAEQGYQSADPELAALQGQVGEAITMLRPSGTARFGTKRVSVVTDGDLIEKGEKIRVLKVEGSRIVVERA